MLSLSHRPIMCRLRSLSQQGFKATKKSFPVVIIYNTFLSASQLELFSNCVNPYNLLKYEYCWFLVDHHHFSFLICPKTNESPNLYLVLLYATYCGMFFDWAISHSCNALILTPEWHLLHCHSNLKHEKLKL